MAKPWVHAQSSARRFGGEAEDYLELHNHIDSTKSAFADNRHRAMTHNAWYIGPGGPLEMAFGATLTNRDGKQVSVRAIAEQHVMEDFGGFIPTLQDFLCEMEFQPWMNGQGEPPSRAKTMKRVVVSD
ncbi:MAG: DUF6915 family protein [Rubripirellula sp.]